MYVIITSLHTIKMVKKYKYIFLLLCHMTTTINNTSSMYYLLLMNLQKKRNSYLQLRKWETCLCPTYFCDPLSPLWIKSTNFQSHQIQYKWNKWSTSLSKMEPFEESLKNFFLDFIKNYLFTILLPCLFIFSFYTSWIASYGSSLQRHTSDWYNGSHLVQIKDVVMVWLLSIDILLIIFNVPFVEISWSFSSSMNKDVILLS